LFVTRYTATGGPPAEPPRLIAFFVSVVKAALDEPHLSSSQWSIVTFPACHGKMPFCAVSWMRTRSTVSVSTNFAPMPCAPP
jgi:hypothetical protein